ncbi:MAG: ADP-dependent NAD(P)H-hydrate dehydratase / NAD(P)H-hydrate epimerase [Thermoleophilaceae bacterium]|jgi:NAD(P)H-hydrate epimerase|nr:ADP-dependent NAD(P)H-hydrate dehydratase / NAD(P)H-hydrate epimerase [Thermoleophilaceae bacterium]
MALPDWLDPLYTAEEMRAVDKWAIEEQGVPSLDLMERAGIGLARITAELAKPGLPIRVVVGKGNNGGDGLVLARLLREEGRAVDVLITGDPADLKGDARANLERLSGPAPDPFDASRLEGSGAIVDAMLGTGFEGEPREPVKSAIEAINAQAADGTPVIACDVPSGVNATTGEVEGDAVRAHCTATFHGPKIGLYVAPGTFDSGDNRVVEIGIPRGAPQPTAAGLITSRVRELVPHRPRDGSKFKSGVMVIAGGSKGLTGAPTMVALAAQRTGAGYVQVAVPRSAEQALELRLLEAMTKGMPEEDGMHTEAGAEQVAEMAERAGAVVLGPGIGKGDGPGAFARALAGATGKPLVIDADGLNAFAGGAIDQLAGREAPTVLTPHAGELGRLLDIDSAEIERRRLQHAREAANRSQAVVLLKGDDTIVAQPGEAPTAISPGATPALATAGTGDVLSGIIGALLAKGLHAFEAAAAGALIHAYAGIEAARSIGGADFVVAGDVIDNIPRAFTR